MFFYQDYDFEFDNRLCSALTQTLRHGPTNDHESDETRLSEHSKAITNNLGMVSSLYLYVNTPPLGYGTQAIKVMETVNRAYSFNLKRKEAKKIKCFGYDVERMHWEQKDGPFPFGQLHGNFIVKEMKKMCIQFLQQNGSTIDSIVEKIMTRISNTNSDILTKGRQTFCPFERRSVTAARAYRNMYNFLVANGAPTTMSCLEWLENYFKLYDKDKLSYKMRHTYTETTKKWDASTSQHVELVKEKTGMRNEVASGKEQCHSLLLEISTSFASYLKHKERGKLDRRAIASANMIKRMFLYIIEEFHLDLGKCIPGSTIAIGGEEKKTKILTSFQTVGTSAETTAVRCQGTEDAQKWNECLAPSCFAAMHLFLFDDCTRVMATTPLASDMGKLFSKIAVFGNFHMALKRIQIGPGVVLNNDKNYRRIKWNWDDVKYCTSNIRTEFRDAQVHLTADGYYLRSSPGMLMGMLNAASTTLGLLPTNHSMNREDMSVITLRSSDDSMTKYMARDQEKLQECLLKHKRSLEMLGINLSTSKTFMFKEGLGEFTSWYMDEGFVSQFGVETASIKPIGQNPADDFHAIARQTATALQTLAINHVGAEARIRLGIENTRRLWRIVRDPTKRTNISDKVLLLSDGGSNPWNTCNCHLQEIPLKEKFIRTQDEKDYILRCQNPENPFSEEIQEELTYSREYGCMMVEEVEVPRNIFNYVRASNRTLNIKISEKAAQDERDYGSAVDLAKSVDPSLYIEIPNSNVLLSNKIKGILETEANELELNEEEKALFDQAIYYLEHGKPDNEEEDFLEDELPE